MGMHYRLNMVADIGHFPPLTRSRKAKRAHLGAFCVFREMAELVKLSPFAQDDSRHIKT